MRELTRREEEKQGAMGKQSDVKIKGAQKT